MCHWLIEGMLPHPPFSKSLVSTVSMSALSLLCNFYPFSRGTMWKCNFLNGGGPHKEKGLWALVGASAEGRSFAWTHGMCWKPLPHWDLKGWSENSWSVKYPLPPYMREKTLGHPKWNARDPPTTHPAQVKSNKCPKTPRPPLCIFMCSSLTFRCGITAIRIKACHYAWQVLLLGLAGLVLKNVCRISWNWM